MTEFLLSLLISLLIFYVFGALLACNKVVEDFKTYKFYGLTPKGKYPILYAIKISLVWFLWIFNDKKCADWIIYYYS